MVDLSGFQKLCDVHDVDMNLELVALFMLIIDKFVFERKASTVANMAIGCQ